MNLQKSTLSRAKADREHYDAISLHLTRKDLAPANRIARRHKLLQTIALTHAKIDSVLEVGCGAGFASEYLEGRCKSYTGIDHSEENIKAAKRIHSHPSRQFERADITDYQSDDRFDGAIMIGVLHHLESPVESLIRIKSLVRPGGVVIANEPQPGNPIITVARMIRKKIDPTYSPDQVEFSRAELESQFKEAGFVDIQITPQGFLSTPFAEVIFPLQRLMAPLSKLACCIDRGLEKTPGVKVWGNRLSWNLVVSGKVP